MAAVANKAEVRSVRRAIATLCLVIFLADVVFGIVAPTFSLFAKNLGITVALIGTINTVGSFVQLLIALPIGLVSDRMSRPRIVANLANFRINKHERGVQPSPGPLIPFCAHARS